jgi:MerR family transcriptional regulator, light-induced transcriptional regulator
MMERYTLNDLEKLTGIKAATIRIWERRYRLISPHRTSTNRRWYENDDLTYLINISILHRNNIKISKIAALTGAELEEKAALLSKDTSDAGIQIDSLILAMISFNENSVNEILLRTIINTGFEDCFTGMVFPFLRRVGLMWHTGSAGIGAEHFISNIFRKRLIAAIDALPPATVAWKKKIIMFLPEDELHELGLLFYAYLIRKLGHELIYLGQSTPFAALAQVNGQWNADILVTGLASGLPYPKPAEYLKNLSITFTRQNIFVSGVLADEADKMHYRNVFSLRSADDLKLLL